jgi:hypothetical protein
VIAKNNVTKKAIIASFFIFAIIAWWAHVIEAPDSNKKIVFNKGTSNGLKTNHNNPRGGHNKPPFILGTKLALKKAQKKSKEKHYFWYNK